MTPESKWRILPTPCLEQIPIDVVESVHTVTVWDLRPNPMAAAIITPIISDSPDESQIQLWVMLKDFTRCEPSTTHTQVVHFRVLEHRARSVSEWISSGPGFCHMYSHSRLGFPMKYFANRLTSWTLNSIVFAKKRQTSSAAYSQSGPSEDK